MQRQVKGYMIQHSGRFILEDPVLSGRVSGALLEQIRRNETAFKAHDWRPVEEAIALWKAVAQLRSPGDDEGAYNDLVGCAEKMAAYATSMWLKLVLKMLTPRMFVRKFPDMFARDHNFGRIEVVSVSDTSFTARFLDVEGYDYFAPIAHGMAATVLRTIGVKDLKMKITPWSIANPGPPELEVNAKWA